jgi:PucR C-terminal helix-turn-helix domain/GGDEF-like domain
VETARDRGGGSHERIRAALAVRVRARRAELEEAIFVRVRDLATHDPAEGDAEYITGLRVAVAAAVDYGLTGVEWGEEWASAIPPAVLTQAHRAARTRVSLDTVLRRYAIGSTLLRDFLMQEADRGDFSDQGAVLRDVLSTQAALLDRLMAAITDAYTREVERAGRSPERRRSEYVQRLLDGGTLDGDELGYELDVWHLGVIATGAGGEGVLARLAASLGRQLLCVARGEQTVWAWLGGRQRLAVGELDRLLGGEEPGEASLAIGEPGWGVEGWRVTHRQAQAALLIALRKPQRLTHYADVALLACVLRDDALARSLVEIYLSPLGKGNRGAVLRQTLRAYFAAERNASSAASALGVARHTVENRLRAIEQKLGRMLYTHQAELEVALRLEELDAPRPEEVETTALDR